MRLHSSYPLGTRTVHLESAELPSDSLSTVQLTMGKTCVVVSVELASSSTLDTAAAPLAVEFTHVSSTRQSEQSHRGAPAANFNQALPALLRQVVTALAPEGIVKRLRIKVRVLSGALGNDALVLSLQGVSTALHFYKPLKIPLAVAVHAAVIDTQLILMPSPAQRRRSDIDFLMVSTIGGLVLLKAQAQDIPHALLIGAVEPAQAHLRSVHEAVQGMVNQTGFMGTSGRDIPVSEPGFDQVTLSIKKAVEAASQFSVASARRLALRAITTRCTAQLQTAGQRVEPPQVDRTLKRLESKSMRQRLLAGHGRMDGRSSRDPSRMSMQLQPQPSDRQSVLIHSGRSQTCITAAPDVLLERPKQQGGVNRLLSDVFLKYVPTSSPQVEHQKDERAQTVHPSPERDFFSFVSMALEPVMLPGVRLSAFATPALSNDIDTPGSAMTGVGGGCMALLFAGAPLQSWVAGADLGLILHGDLGMVLLDPLVSEEPLLDAQLKVASTCHGITAVELVANTPGVSLSLLESALAQGVDLCRRRLVDMRKVLLGTPGTMRPTVAHSRTLHIDPELTHEVMVRSRDAVAQLCEAAGARVRVDAQGWVTVEAPSAKQLDRAYRQFKMIVADALKNGALVEAEVVEVIEFLGVRLATKDGKSALLHTSRMTPTALKEGLDVGDRIAIRLLGRDVLGTYRAEMPADPGLVPDDPMVTS